MFFMGKRLFTLFNVGVAIMAGLLFVACLDLPNDPDIQNKIEKVSVFITQNGYKDSVLLKINPSDTSTLIAKVYPEKYKNQVKYYWYNDDEILDSGRTYTIPPSIAQTQQTRDWFIPKSLVILDNEGNSLETTFKIIANTPPHLLKGTSPFDGDTLYGNRHTAFSFKWTAVDYDEGQILSYVLEIDGKAYHVGPLTQIKQSGFSEGNHRYRILVSDTYGDMDSIPFQQFFVKDSSGDRL